MTNSIYIGSSGLRAQQQVIDTISNNIANLNSTAYKRQGAKLSTLLAETENSTSPSLSETKGLGVTVSSINRNMSQGQLQLSSRPLDLAIQGGGFFILQKEDGETTYARAGAFKVSQEGYLVDQNNSRLQPEIQINDNASNLIIGRTGLVTVVNSDGTVQQLGQLEIARFQNPDALKLDASGAYLTTEHSGEASNTLPGQENSGLIMQGYLETSNVNLVDEFTSLVMAQRSYEASAKVVQTAGELFDATNALLRA